MSVHHARIKVILTRRSLPRCSLLECSSLISVVFRLGAQYLILSRVEPVVASVERLLEGSSASPLFT